MSEQVVENGVVDTAPKRTRKNFDVTKEQFLAAMTEANDVQDVANKTGLPLRVVYSRIATYKKAGEQLRKLNRRKRVKNQETVDVVTPEQVVS